MSRVLPVVSIVLACACVVGPRGAAAQERPETVRLVLAERGAVTGALLRLADAEATLLVGGVREEFPLDSILSIERRGDRIWNGALIGAAVGLLPLLTSRGEMPGGWVAASVGSWTALGAGVDALIPGWTPIYLKRQAGGPEGRPQPNAPRVRHTVRPGGVR